MQNRYSVKTETKGTLYFDELPKNTYFLEGLQDENDRGKATFFTNDNGTCLIPIIDTKTGKQVIDTKKARKEIN